ncbi:hypothetical protein [Shewanella algae]|uniref:hypothetical protein n=1 Tax=Shewanella algae TaxID=38313 RepID=UPI0011841733|nr:hypothetical protein [Shewanella algae]
MTQIYEHYQNGQQSGSREITIVIFPIFSNKLIRGINIGGMTIPLQVNYCPVESLTPTNGPSGRIDNGGNKLLLFKPGIGLTYCPELVDSYNRFQLTVWQSRRSVTLAVQFPSNKKGPSLRIALRG